MNFIPFLVFLAVLVVAPISADPEPFANPHPVPRPVPINFPGKSWIESWFPSMSSLPDLVSKFFPSAANIFSMSKNLLAGTPAKVVAYYVNKVCGFAAYTNLLQQTYSPPKHELYFDLHTPHNVTRFPLEHPLEMLADEKFNPSFGVVVFVSGWESVKNQNDPDNVVYMMSEAYQSRGQYNFIVFDVGQFVNSLYRWASVDILFLGEMLGNALSKLANKVPISNIHVVGHSLGAHIAGVAGRRFQTSTGQQIPRITGLDPAMPCLKRSIVLQSGDASFVDIIHTNNNVLGIREAIGDVDFYPNGAVPLPPGCFNVICAHNRAVYYYVESVLPGNQDNFQAIRCASINEYNTKRCEGKQIPMGYATPSYARGTYYLETNRNPPFGQNAA